MGWQFGWYTIVFTYFPTVFTGKNRSNINADFFKPFIAMRAQNNRNPQFFQYINPLLIRNAPTIKQDNINALSWVFSLKGIDNTLADINLLRSGKSFRNGKIL